MLGKYFGGKNRSPQLGRLPRLQVWALKDADVKEDFNLQLHDLMSEGFFDEGYPLFGHAMRVVGAKKVGTVEGSALPEWKQVNQDRLAELSVLKKRTAQKAPQGVRSAEFKRVAAAAKKEVRQMINKWWREKAARIQERVDAKDVCGL